MWKVQNKIAYQLFNTFHLQVTSFVPQLLLKHLMNCCSRNAYCKFAILMHMKLNKEDCMSKVPELQVGCIPNYTLNLHQAIIQIEKKTCISKSQFVMLSHLVMLSR